MGRAFGLKDVESFAVPSGVFVSYEKEDGSHETAVLRVHRKGINLTRVNVVNSDFPAGRARGDHAGRGAACAASH